MKKIVLSVLSLICATAMTVHADDAAPAKTKLTPEQKALRKEMIAKYDTNKDGKVDKQEAKSITQEDRDKMAKAGITITGKRTKHTSSESTTAKPTAN